MVLLILKISDLFKSINKGLILKAFIIVLIPFISKSQNVVIPDSTFKNWILNNIAHPANTKEISISEAAAYTGNINVSAINITSLSGIESFTTIDSLDCSYNNLSTLNIKACKSLLYLNCNYTGITKLDVSGNTFLTSLYCGYTAIDTLNVSVNTNIMYFFCGYSNISSLDVTKNNKLIYLGCNNSKINVIDVTKNVQLQYLFCNYTNISNIDVSKNVSLQYLGCNNSNLTNIDVNKNTVLEYLSCNNTGITSLNVTNNTTLQYLYCGNTFLTSIDVSNNKQLTYFGCNNSKLSTLNVTANNLLNYLGCNNNSITSLDVSKNTALNYLYCGYTSISTLDVSKNILLNTLSCNYSFLSSLDISTNNLLDTLYCNHDSLSSLNMNNGNNARLAKFTAKNNLILTCVEVDTVAYANIHWKSFVDTIAQFSTHCSLLPVSLISFSAYRDKQGNIFIEWSLVNKINNSIFEIERAVDGVIFSSIGSVSTLGNGNLQYQFQDINPLLGNVYYRLKMADKDGRFNYSKVVEINSTNINQQFTIYPNPVINELNIIKTISVAEPVSILLYDMLGNVLLQKSIQFNLGSNTIKIPTTALSAGTFCLRIKGNTFIEQKMFVK